MIVVEPRPLRVTDLSLRDSSSTLSCHPDYSPSAYEETASNRYLIERKSYVGEFHCVGRWVWLWVLATPLPADATETRAPIHRGEKLLTPGYATDLELKIPATIEGPKRTERAWGRVWLTDQRVGCGTLSETGGLAGFSFSSSPSEQLASSDKLTADDLYRAQATRWRGPECAAEE